jgi:hypothetical protein
MSDPCVVDGYSECANVSSVGVNTTEVAAGAESGSAETSPSMSRPTRART